MNDPRPVEGRPSEDVDAVARARDGDVGAFEALVARYQGVAFRVAWLVVRNRGEAEDAVQDAFVKAYYALPRFRPGAPFRPWILRIVANEARNRSRSARRRDGLAMRVAASEPGQVMPSPEGAVLDRTEAEALVLALERLPERDRHVLALRYLLELSEAETAEVLGVRPGTVKSRLSRALARLRAEVPNSASFAEVDER
ncbi:MAG: sigma-70 family RNA polymerase sigma factor [Actinomycetota bacterium]|nr:sigma-70 family RNA polymerase sigma factor [Actinomycetota bacterium]MDH5224149.1 sigma-70 family RNA polymerase sigma factor [Actinomycetota bacterium]MDH5312301.1 sigma-70 family RNA polymerase sigma factor [Actinomycetota bacterium]